MRAAAILVPAATEGPARFQTFGPDHLALLLVALAGSVAAAVVSRRLRARRGARAPGDGVPVGQRLAAVGLLAIALPLQVWQWLPEEFNRGNSWPVHLCDLSWILAAFALWTGNRRAAQLLYYWGLTLVPQAMLTPDLVQVFPHPRYLMFWVLHLLVVWISVYLTWGTAARPSWRGYRFAVAATLGWMAFTMTFNTVLDTNYGYLNDKPPGASVLDFFPEWPWYVAVQIALVAVVWALMTLPWVRSGARGARIRSDAPTGGTLAGS